MEAWDSVQQVEAAGGTFRVRCAGHKGPTVLLLHGAGHSAMTWTLVAARLKQHCSLIAIDLRGHGGTKTPKETELPMSTLVSDVLAVLQEILQQPTKLVVVGHSMGGALAVHLALTIEPSMPISISGIVMMDIVEGTALAALGTAKQILSSRSESFGSEQEAVEWALASGTLRNIASAVLSIPDQLRQEADGQRYLWRTDMASSEQYWASWFTGLSALFLSVQAPKMLMLAGTDRLDTDLTIRQMQGKFQMVVMSGCGHTMQEDSPDQAAQKLLQFVARVS